MLKFINYLSLSNFVDKKKWFLLLIVPLSYFFLGSYIHQIIGIYSLRSVDPEYIYFMSGLSIANGKLMLGHIDNPGTPLQYLTALVFRAVYLFRSHQISFNEDVFSNADMYLRVLNIVLTAVVSIFVFYAGKLTYKITHSISFSILLQFSPFFTTIIFGNIGRISPENLLPIPVMLLSILLLKTIYNEEESNRKNILLFGLISAFGLSIKLTYFPLCIIPIMVIKVTKNKIIYLASTLVSFFVIAIPVTLQINVFWSWIKGLLFHSGHYGKGENNIVNWKTVIPNFKYLFHENPFFFYIVLLLLIILLASFLFNKQTSRHHLIQRISIAVLCAIGLHVAIVCKQFEYRYFIPALMLLPLSVFLIIELLLPLHFPLSKYKIPQLAISLFLIIYINKQIPVIQTLSYDLDQDKLRKAPTWNYMQTLDKNVVKFLVPNYYWAPSPEYGLLFGYCWSGEQHAYFKPVLAKLFPNTYIYFSWDKTLNYWNNLPEIEKMNNPVFIYFENENLKDTFFSDTKAYFPEKYNLIRTFFNEQTNESVYRLVKESDDQLVNQK